MSRIALQLYTVRDLCAKDLAGSLARTAALGFDGVELHDLYGHTADAVRHLLDENGLVACSRHALLPSIESELEELAEELRILGTDRLVDRMDRGTCNRCRRRRGSGSDSGGCGASSCAGPSSRVPQPRR